MHVHVLNSKAEVLTMAKLTDMHDYSDTGIGGTTVEAAILGSMAFTAEKLYNNLCIKWRVSQLINL